MGKRFIGFTFCLFLIFFPAIALAQAGICKAGAPCRVSSLSTTGAVAASGTISSPTGFVSTNPNGGVVLGPSSQFQVTWNGGANVSQLYSSSSQFNFLGSTGTAVSSSLSGGTIGAAVGFTGGYFSGSYGRFTSDVFASGFQPTHAYASPANLFNPVGAPTYLTSDTATSRLWNSGKGIEWHDLASGLHPVLDGSVFSVKATPMAAVCPVVLKNVTNLNPGTLSTSDCTGTGTTTSLLASGDPRRQYFFLTTTATVNNSYVWDTDHAIAQGMFTGATAQPRQCARVMTGSSIYPARFWVGYGNITPANASDTINGGSVAFRFSSIGGDTAWQVCSDDGTASCVTTGVTVTVSTEYLLCLDLRTETTLYATVVKLGSAPVTVAKTTNISSLLGGQVHPFVKVDNADGGVMNFGMNTLSMEFSQ